MRLPLDLFGASTYVSVDSLYNGMGFSDFAAGRGCASRPFSLQSASFAPKTLLWLLAMRSKTENKLAYLNSK